MTRPRLRTHAVESLGLDHTGGGDRTGAALRLYQLGSGAARLSVRRSVQRHRRQAGVGRALPSLSCLPMAVERRSTPTGRRPWARFWASMSIRCALPRRLPGRDHSRQLFAAARPAETETVNCRRFHQSDAGYQPLAHPLQPLRHPRDFDAADLSAGPWASSGWAATRQHDAVRLIAYLLSGVLVGLTPWTHPGGRLVPFILIFYVGWLLWRQPSTRGWKIDGVVGAWPSQG